MIVRFNESESYFNAKEIVGNIREICKGLSDEDINYVVEPSNDIKIKLIGLWIKGNEENGPFPSIPFYVRILMRENLIGESLKKEAILNTLKHLETYIQTEGLKFKYELFFKSFPLPKWLDHKQATRYIIVDSIDARIFDKINPAIEIKIIFDK